jgi:anti-sigma regulatory factor (Ser/Thr protein kinase)
MAANVFVAPSLPSTPRGARRVTEAFLQFSGISGESADNAALLITELVTNAVAANLAAGAPDGTLIWVSLRHFQEGLLIEVSDSSPNPPVPADAAEMAENGRGLMLVEALSRDWGYYPWAGKGKVVYCLVEAPALSG